MRRLCILLLSCLRQTTSQSLVWEVVSTSKCSTSKSGNSSVHVYVVVLLFAVLLIQLCNLYFVIFVSTDRGNRVWKPWQRQRRLKLWLHGISSALAHCYTQEAVYVINISKIKTASSIPIIINHTNYVKKRSVLNCNYSSLQSLWCQRLVSPT